MTCDVSHLYQVIPSNTGLCMHILHIFMFNIAFDNVISIEDNNAESYSNKSSKPNNTNVSSGKKVNSRHNKNKQERKKEQIVTATVGDFMV